MKCWICPADEKATGDHKIKASDLKALFRKPSQKKPLFLSTDLRRNIKIGSIKRSPHLKSKAPMCAYCNNTRTAPHDETWRKLSKYLREKRPIIKSNETIKLSKIFRGSVKRSMLDVHLFFVKVFGCAISENNISIDISGFSDAIMHQKAHPLIHLVFSPSIENGLKKYAG